MLDTSVIVAAFRSPHGASRQLFTLFDQHRFEVLLSPALFLEYEDVLNRPKQKAVHGLSESQVTTILGTLASRSVLIQIHYSWRPQLRDANDEFVLDLAVNGRATAIITHNTADFLPEALAFGIEIYTPGSIIKKRFEV